MPKKRVHYYVRAKPEPKLVRGEVSDGTVVQAVHCPFCFAPKGERCHRRVPNLLIEDGGPCRPHPERWVLYRRKLRAQKLTRRIEVSAR